MYQIINVTMDCVCTLFTLLILAYLRLSPDRGERLNLLFAWICVFNIGMLLGDIPNWLCEGLARPWYPAVLWLGCLVQYLSGCLIIGVYSMYLHAYLSHKIKLKGWTLPLILLLCAVDAAFIVCNLWSGMYYRIVRGNYYQRGDWYWLSQIIPVVVLLIDAGVILYHRYVLHNKEIMAFLVYLMLPVIGVIIQMQFYGVAVTYLASSVALFIIFLCVQSEQLLVAEQQKRDLDKAQVMVMLSQIQPHFLYNTLTAIEYLCNRDGAMQAGKVVRDFSKYLRKNLDSLTRKHPIPFVDELEHTKLYLSIEQLQYEERLKVEFDIQAADFFLPALTLQPLVENAVKHGVSKRAKSGKITIQTNEEESYWRVMVMDDGIGFNPADQKQDGRQHIGIENVRRRLESVCGGSLSITSKPGTGTKVILSIPKGAHYEYHCGG